MPIASSVCARSFFFYLMYFLFFYLFNAYHLGVSPTHAYTSTPFFPHSSVQRTIVLWRCLLFVSANVYLYTLKTSFFAWSLLFFFSPGSQNTIYSYTRRYAVCTKIRYKYVYYFTIVKYDIMCPSTTIRVKLGRESSPIYILDSELSKECVVSTVMSFFLFFVPLWKFFLVERVVHSQNATVLKRVWESGRAWYFIWSVF